MDTSPRIYAQMRPDLAGCRELLEVQAGLVGQKSGRIIGPDELHLTLIHFGKTEQLYAAIEPLLTIDKATYERELDRYIAETTTALPKAPVELRFTGYDLFRPKRTALVAEFAATDELRMIHTTLVDILTSFFDRIGVKDSVGFLNADPNFRHSMTLKPHVTLYKGYAGDVPTMPIGSVRFEPMKVVY